MPKFIEADKFGRRRHFTLAIPEREVSESLDVLISAYREMTYTDLIKRIVLERAQLHRELDDLVKHAISNGRDTMPIHEAIGRLRGYGKGYHINNRSNLIAELHNAVMAAGDTANV